MNHQDTPAIILGLLIWAGVLLAAFFGALWLFGADEVIAALAVLDRSEILNCIAFMAVVAGWVICVVGVWFLLEGRTTPESTP